MSRLPEHYETVRNRNGYDRFAGDVGPLSAGEYGRRFVAVDGREPLARANERETVVTTGVGMTGPPHLGTVGQILTAVALQRAGLDVQFVLADLEPYHGGAALERVRALADRYRAFVRDLGFDPAQGTLRTQEEAREVMHTAEILSPYYRPDEWDDPPEFEPTAWERAVEAAYDDAASREEPTVDGEIESPDSADTGRTSEAASVHSAVLHGVDFLHPLWANDYEQVILTFGVDEHHLTPWSRRFRDAAPVEGAIAGLYTRMLPGLDGSPKMSKSIPGSGVTLDVPAESIRERIRGAHESNDPAASPIFQAMCLASEYDPERLASLEAACAAGGEEWHAAKAEYAEYVVELAQRWRATAE